MSSKSRSQLYTEINTLFADNNTGDITAGDARTVLTDLVDSNSNIIDSASQSVVFGSAGAVNNGVNSVILGSPLSTIALGVTNSTIIGGNAISVTQSGQTVISGVVLNTNLGLNQVLTNSNKTNGKNIILNSGDKINTNSGQGYITTNEITVFGYGSASEIDIITDIFNASSNIGGVSIYFQDTATGSANMLLNTNNSNLNLGDGGNFISDNSATPFITINTNNTIEYISDDCDWKYTTGTNSGSIATHTRSNLVLAGGDTILSDENAQVTQQVTIKTSNASLILNDDDITTTSNSLDIIVGSTIAEYDITGLSMSNYNSGTGITNSFHLSQPDTNIAADYQSSMITLPNGDYVSTSIYGLSSFNSDWTAITIDSPNSVSNARSAVFEIDTQALNNNPAATIFAGFQNGPSSSSIILAATESHFYTPKLKVGTSSNILSTAYTGTASGILTVINGIVTAQTGAGAFTGPTGSMGPTGPAATLNTHQVLVDDTTIEWNFASGNFAEVTLFGTDRILYVYGMTYGESGWLRVIQSSGNCTIDFTSGTNSSFNRSPGAIYSFSTATFAEDVYTFTYDFDGNFYWTYNLGFA